MTNSTPKAQADLQKHSFAHEAQRAGLYDPSFPILLGRGEGVCPQGDTSEVVILLESGMCTAVKYLPNGQRQNVAIHLPGDILGHEVLTLGTTTSALVTLTRVTCHRLKVARLEKALEEHAGLAQAFWRYVAYQGALGQEWMVSLGQRPAYERMAHFLCEMVCRLRPIDQADETRCALPFSQGDLAAVLGLSLVHVNRVLQKLRGQGLINLESGQLDVLDWHRLSSIATFDPTYIDLAYASRPAGSGRLSPASSD